MRLTRHEIPVIFHSASLILLSFWPACGEKRLLTLAGNVSCFQLRQDLLMRQVYVFYNNKKALVFLFISALQIPDGDYFLNGGVSRSPESNYEAAGTVFSYKTTKECYGQCIFAQGPTDRAVNLLVNFSVCG